MYGSWQPWHTLCLCRYFDPVSPSPLILNVLMDDQWAHVVPGAAVENLWNSSFHTFFDCLLVDLSLLAFANLANVRWKNAGHVKIFSIRFIKKQELFDFVNPVFFMGCPALLIPEMSLMLLCCLAMESDTK